MWNEFLSRHHTVKHKTWIWLRAGHYGAWGDGSRIWSIRSTQVRIHYILRKSATVRGLQKMVSSRYRIHQPPCTETLLQDSLTEDAEVSSTTRR